MFAATVGIDWGSKEHAVYVVPAHGTRARGWTVPHTPEGIQNLCEALRGLAHPHQVAIAIERPDGLLVEALVEAEFPVFHINPKQLDRFRDRFNVAGAKDNTLDARVLAHCLATDKPLFSPVPPLEDWQHELRRLTRVEGSFTRRIVAQANRLHACLSRHFPQMLDLSTGLTRSQWILNLIDAVPEPAAARSLDPSDLARLLRRTALEPEGVLAVLGGKEFIVSAGVRRACTLEASFLVAQLRLLRSQRKVCQQRIHQIVEELATPVVCEEAETKEVSSQERSLEGIDAAEGDSASEGWACDIAVLRSLPGVGDKSLAGLLAEVPQLLQTRDYRRLRALAGVAPVTRRTGERGKKRPSVSMRRACRRQLRFLVHQMAGNAIRTDSKFRLLYRHARSRGHSHARALRTVGDRMLAVLCACLRDGTTYLPRDSKIALAS